MKRLAIIPARGGSKRIPRKNIKEFLNKPMMTYSIEVALSSGLFDEVMVSTDDVEIASIAKEYGATVPFMRSEAAADDYSTLSDVIREVVDTYAKSGSTFDYICCILPTAPLLKVEDITSAYNILITKGFDTVYPIVRFSYPILRSLKIDSDGRVVMRWPEFRDTRSQDLDPAFHDSGTFYWLRNGSFIRYGQILTPNTGSIEIDEIRVQDIDTETDWKLAELKYTLLCQQKEK